MKLRLRGILALSLLILAQALHGQSTWPILVTAEDRIVRIDTAVARPRADHTATVRLHVTFSHDHVQLSPPGTYRSVALTNEVDCTRSRWRLLSSVAFDAEGIKVSEEQYPAIGWSAAATQTDSVTIEGICSVLAARPVPSQPSFVFTDEQARRVRATNLPESYVASVAATGTRGFDFRVFGYDNDNYPQEYLGDRLAAWMDRSRYLGRNPSCFRQPSGEIACGYTLFRLPDATGRNILDGPIQIAVAFKDSVAVTVAAEFPLNLFSGAVQGSLDRNFQALFELLFGPPNTSQDLTIRTSVWRSETTIFGRQLDTDARIPMVRWTWLRI